MVMWWIKSFQLLCVNSLEKWESHSMYGEWGERGRGGGGEWVCHGVFSQHVIGISTCICQTGGWMKGVLCLVTAHVITETDLGLISRGWVKIGESQGGGGGGVIVTNIHVHVGGWMKGVLWTTQCDALALGGEGGVGVRVYCYVM